MARQTTFATTLFTIFLLLAANAVLAYRTTIPTIEVDINFKGDRYGRSDSCEEEIEEKDLSVCKAFIKGGTLSTILAMPGDRQSYNKLSDRLGCCRELGKFDEICVCDALNYVIKEADGGDDAVSRAQNLLIYCRMPLGCNFGKKRLLA
ncbi:2S albumin [Tripterygium wilfordii]|uniref:2S albumin n=1 Tax=Tripterygium wilfordii TaxID=458696 RepID=A0A7J7C1E5_TRIWF|nr:2S albumin-like [Tripterygium wilfordii]KAF5727980.1 2S albumin [Tripterygium wilfordii]